MVADPVPEVNVTGGLPGPPGSAAIAIAVPLASVNVADGEPGSQQEKDDLSDTVAPKYSEPSPKPGELGGEKARSLALQGGELGADGVVGAGVGACDASHGTDDGDALSAPVEGLSVTAPAGCEVPRAPRDVTTAAAVSNPAATAVAALRSLFRCGLMSLPLVVPKSYTGRRPGRWQRVWLGSRCAPPPSSDAMKREASRLPR